MKAEAGLAMLKQRMSIIGDSRTGLSIFRCSCGAVTTQPEDGASHQPGCKLPPVIERVCWAYSTHLASLFDYGR